MTVTCSKKVHISEVFAGILDISFKWKACMTKLVIQDPVVFNRICSYSIEIEEAVKTGKIEEWIIQLKRFF